MLHIAIQIQEVVSSNLNSMVAAATNPVKMLGLFQRQLQDYMVSLQSDLNRTRRRQEQLARQAERLEQTVTEWTAKAQTAMDHKREDLAHAALLAREQIAADAERAGAASRAARAEADEMGEAVAQLQAKLAETDARIVKERARAAEQRPAPTVAPSRGERVLDRVEAFERRVDFAVEAKVKSTPASVDAEIEQLRREAKIGEELAAMKAAAKAAPRRKTAAKKTAR